MKIVESWDTEANFWEVNPQFKVPEAFSKLYKEDKSKGKVESSKIMWALALYCDYDSKYRQIPDLERKNLITVDLLRTNSFDWNVYSDQIKAWDLFKSAAMRQMTEWERFMNEKSDFMKTLKYNGETAEQIEKLLLSNSKLYDEYQKINERLAQEGEAGTVFGGGIESASERGDI